MRLLSSLLFSMIVGLACGQDRLFLEGDQALQQAEYEKALGLFRQAMDTYRLNDEFSGYAECNLKSTECLLAMGEPQQAISLAEEMETYIREVVKGESHLLAEAKRLTGSGYLIIGRYDLSEEKLLEAEKLFAPNSLDLAKCYSELGVMYGNSGNTDLALQFQEKALDIRKQKLEENDELLADSYNNIGLIYLKEEPLQAIIYFNRALTIYKSKLDKTHPKIANCLNNIAFANADLNNFQDALQYLESVNEIWETIYKGDHPNKAFALSNKGRVLEMQGTYDEALMLYQDALQIYLRLYGPKHPEIANSYFLIGRVQQKKVDFRSAVESFQQSIYANLFDQEFSTVYDIPEIRDYYNADVLLSSLQSKAIALEALHFEKTLKLRDIDGALKTYQACDDLISQIRQLRISESDKLKLGNTATEVYDRAINIAVFLSQRTLNKKYYLQEAFNFCERSKSAVLLEAISDTKAKSFAGIPDQKLATEDSLKTRISLLKQRLAQAESADNIETLKNQLFTFESALRAFVTELEENYPQYFKLKYDQKIATAEELQSILPPATGVLAYFTGENNLYIFLVTRNKLTAFTHPREENFYQQIKAFRNSMKYQLYESLVSSATALYDQLIPKLPSQIEKLVILPDGVLGTVPFESLISKVEEGSANYNAHTFLLQEYRISYDYSATLLADRLRQKASENTKGILLTAPVSFEHNEIAMQTLPDSEREIKEIKYLFGGANQEAVMSVNRSASESMIKSQEVCNYKYLHFATHGMVDESSPELSRIFLSPDEHEDGSLYSGEIYNLKINADLVALSACETGLGKITKGEGIVGLSRALMYAGAKNLMVSLWQVADASTAQLMIEFYKQHLYHSGDIYFGDDLYKAKLSLLQSEKYQNPYYWAPFVLVGL